MHAAKFSIEEAVYLSGTCNRIGLTTIDLERIGSILILKPDLNLSMTRISSLHESLRKKPHLIKGNN